MVRTAGGQLVTPAHTANDGRQRTEEEEHATKPYPSQGTTI